jgi:hypothetical protein
VLNTSTLAHQGRWGASTLPEPSGERSAFTNRYTQHGRSMHQRLAEQFEFLAA